MSGRTYCDDDLAGLLGPSRQPSITDATTGGRDSLLEAICWLDDVALTSRLGLRVQMRSLTLI